MNTLYKIRSNYQKFIENNFITIQLYFSVAFISFLYMILDNSQPNFMIALLKAIFWPIAALLALLF
jgi:hypothetical protein